MCCPRATMLAARQGRLLSNSSGLQGGCVLLSPVRATPVHALQRMTCRWLRQGISDALSALHPPEVLAASPARGTAVAPGAKTGSAQVQALTASIADCLS